MKTELRHLDLSWELTYKTIGTGFVGFVGAIPGNPLIARSEPPV
jgi:hypothetical protein